MLLANRKPMFSGFIRRGIAVLLLLLAFMPGSQAQNYVLDIKRIDLNDYPNVKAEVWTRDPNGLDTSKLSAFEGNKEVKLIYKGKKDSVLSQKNKCIVFLVLNPGTSPMAQVELAWYKKVLKGSISSNTIKKGDKVAVLDFNQQISGQILYPSMLNLTDNLDELNDRIDNIKNRSNPSTCSNRGSLVLPAIDRVMDLIKQQNLDMPAGIVVLSDDVVCQSNQLEDPVTKARRLNIPIYGITFSAIRRPHNSIDRLCTKSFGDYSQDYAPRGSFNVSVNQLTGYLNSFLVKNKGLLYKYEWKSTLPKDGEQHTTTLKYEDITTDYSFASPAKNILEWAIANPLMGLGLFLIISLMIYGGYFYVNRQKKLQQKQKDQLEALQREQEAKAAQHAQQLQQQQREVEQIKDRERRERQKVEEQKRTEARANEEKELIRRMKLRGVLPSMDCMAPGASFVFTVAKPEVLIGRNNDCDLTLNYPTVSKKHCKINFINNGYMLEDLGSSNGTTVNNRRVQKVMLKHGDIIRLGEVVINFRM